MPQHKPILLTREQATAQTLTRDGHRCIICGRGPNDGIKLDAHHIMNRRLWDDGGYYLENLVTLCDDNATHCHFKVKATLISCEELRKRANIKINLIPEHLDQDEGERYDCWGNQILPTGIRLKGELFTDPGCQQMLKAANLLRSFSKYCKYPRTMHLPWSPNLQNNDRRIKNLDAFIGQEVVVTEKRDGENCTLYNDYLHARSLDSKDHPSRAIIRQLHGAFAHEIPRGWRICGENLYAQHSIAYSNLPAFFEVFNIWDENNYCLGWNEMEAYASMIGSGIAPGFENGLPIVPVLYRGIWNEPAIRALETQINTNQIEGYVVRVANRIHYSEWRRKAAKFVREKHVQTDEHWMRSWKPNKLKPATN
jgi:hypothetical protein